MSNPLFDSSLLGSRLKIWPTFLEYKAGLLNPKTTISIKDIASVEQIFTVVFFIGLREVRVETTGGKRINLLLRSKDRDAVVQTILKAKNNL